MRIIIFIFTIIIFSTFSSAFAQEYQGKVIGISDGDTFTLLTKEHEKIKVRLAEIDAPEKGQPYGQKSRQALSDMIFQKDVLVVQTDIDKYGRTVGKVYDGDIYVNADMIRTGAAWVYREYANDESLFSVENEAKEHKAGVWGLSEAENMAPWEWRHQERQQKAANDNQMIAACTMEAKQCPDGSFVSRSGPNCEFSPCPTVNDNSTERGGSPANDNWPPAQSYEPPPASSYAQPDPAPSTGRACCKHCSKGIPCGDSCISASKTCHKPPGCAC